jgi:DNA ligase D-like protein (predicted 3'-phosphoesterase)
MNENEILRDYREKRNFGKTSEPYGKKEEETRVPIFVVQKHAATNLHYDFRLEIGNVLVSWAVPKGPSTDPSVKRLAVRTEDHPLEYANFEGKIPEGEYGAGEVQIWDTGTYQNITEKEGVPISLPEALQHGHLHLWMKGKRLQGGYAISRMGPGKNWLLVKTKDVK